MDLGKFGRGKEGEGGQEEMAMKDREG